MSVSPHFVNFPFTPFGGTNSAINYQPSHQFLRVLCAFLRPFCSLARNQRHNRENRSRQLQFVRCVFQWFRMHGHFCRIIPVDDDAYLCLSVCELLSSAKFQQTQSESNTSNDNLPNAPNLTSIARPAKPGPISFARPSTMRRKRNLLHTRTQKERSKQLLCVCCCCCCARTWR